MSYVQQFCVYERNSELVQCGTISALLCEIVYIGIRFEFVTYRIVVFMEGSDRECSVARLVNTVWHFLYWSLVLSVLHTAILVLWKEQTGSTFWQV